jgi:type I restriction-modification system DNA methylase subunit
MNVADMIVAMTCQGASAGQKILDPCVGSGVFLIAALKAVPSGVQLYGVEIDRTLYRAALVQLTIFTDHGKRNPFFLLNDDSLMNPLSDWSSANLWTPLN